MEGLLGVLQGLILLLLHYLFPILALLTAWFMLRHFVTYVRTAFEYAAAAERQGKLRLVPILALDAQQVPETDSVKISLSNVGQGPAFNIWMQPVEISHWKIRLEAPSFLRQGDECEDLKVTVENRGSVQGETSWLTFLAEAESWNPGQLELEIACSYADVQNHKFQVRLSLVVKRQQGAVESISSHFHGPDLSVLDAPKPLAKQSGRKMKDSRAVAAM